MSPQDEVELAAIQKRAGRLHPDNPLDLFRALGIVWRFSRLCFREAARQRRARRSAS